MCLTFDEAWCEEARAWAAALLASGHESVRASEMRRLVEASPPHEPATRMQALVICL